MDPVSLNPTPEPSSSLKRKTKSTHVAPRLIPLGLALFLGSFVGVPALIMVVGIVSHFVTYKFAWSELDWNNDGSTSLDEIWRSLDIGARTVSIHGRTCRQFFSLKDGLPIRDVCYDNAG